MSSPRTEENGRYCEGGRRLWSAAIYRRFLGVRDNEGSLDARSQVQSGDKSPHSKMSVRPQTIPVQRPILLLHSVFSWHLFLGVGQEVVYEVNRVAVQRGG